MVRKGPRAWFAKSAHFDREIKKTFLKTYEAIVRGEHAAWRSQPRGRLAEIIVLDQFARNMFRGTKRMFEHDALALALAQEAIRAGAEKKLSPEERVFLYMPFEHSESKLIQRESLRLFRTLGRKENQAYAKDHARIIARFGRFPHRNKVLGRTSTKAEKAFMRIHKGY